MQAVIMAPTCQNTHQPFDACPIQRKVSQSRTNDLSDEQQLTAAGLLQNPYGLPEPPQRHLFAGMRGKPRICNASKAQNAILTAL